MAIYGDQLAFFPEQFRMFDYFHMTPIATGSYSQREDLGKIRAIFQYVRKGDLVRENDTEADTNVPTLWTKTKLTVGDYFIQKDDELYRIVSDYPWHFEGGFYCYSLASFIGSSDVQQPFEYVDLGQNSYD